MDEKVVKLKKDLKKRGIRGLALDVDETLADTNTRWFEHMFNFHTPDIMSKEEIMKTYKYIQNVPSPEWQSKEAFEFMDGMMHSNEFNENIPLITDSNHIARKINETISIVAYITARPGTVIPGTKKWLDKHGFPEAQIITQSANVHASDEHTNNRNIWKASVLNYLYPEVTAIVDDNYGLVDELKKLNYKGIHYLYGKQSKEIKDHKNVVVCETGQDVLKAIVK